MNISFVKMHTNGNDFMIIDNRSNSLLFTAEKVASIANRKTGVGFDQLILLEDSRDFGREYASSLHVYTKEKNGPGRLY